MLAAHARGLVGDVVARGLVPDGALVATTASHGNHLATFFADRRVNAVILESDPAVVRRLEAAGFRAVAGGPHDPDQALAGLGRPADLVVDHFLLAHLADPVGALAGYRRLTRSGGALVLELDHWLPTFVGRQWDAIRHGHVSYLSLGWLAPALDAAGFVVEDATPQDVYGGSLRVLARAVEQASVTRRAAGSLVVLEAEARAGLDRPHALDQFASEVAASVAATRDHLSRAVAAGRRTAAYGAPARGNTFLNAVGPVAARAISYAVDAAPGKQGRVLPGSRIAVRSPAALRGEPVDDVLVLPWDLAPEIAVQLADVRAAGARLLVGVPALRILDARGGISDQPVGVAGGRSASDASPEVTR